MRNKTRIFHNPKIDDIAGHPDDAITPDYLNYWSYPYWTPRQILTVVMLNQIVCEQVNESKY